MNYFLKDLPLISVVRGELALDKPLMVVLHGRGDSPAGFEWLPDALGFSEMSYVFLQAPDPYFEGYSWYELPPNQLPGIQRSQKLLEQVFEKIIQTGFAPERVFLFGFSQGCLMTLEFGGRFPHRLAGYIGVSGYCYDTEALIREASPEAKKGAWLVTHGTLDGVLPVSTTREQVEILQKNGLPIEYREYRKAHTLDDQNEIPFLKAWIQARL